MTKIKTLSIVLLFVSSVSLAEARWSVASERTAIEWNVAADSRLPHSDKLEMSGLGASLVFEYAVDGSRRLSTRRSVYWPSLRIQPNDTRGTLHEDFADSDLPRLLLDGAVVTDRVESVRFDGVWTCRSTVDDLAITRSVAPAADSRLVFERIEVENRGKTVRRVSLSAPPAPRYRLGCSARYAVETGVEGDETPLAPGGRTVFGVRISARRVDEAPLSVGIDSLLASRRRRMAELASGCVFVSGIPELDLAFRFAALRAGESVFATAGGLMHSPGGGSYYAGTWCNDQVEYAGPWFAFTGDPTVLEASLNAYLHYMPFMAPDYEPIPSSVIAEGRDYWNGRRDRGDAAMWAYGAARFVLVSGRRDWAKRLLPGLRWTLEYCRRQMNAAGVVASDTDELERRLPSGDANLCTSALCYDALRHAAIVERDLGDAALAEEYDRRATALAAAIGRHFAAEIHGFETYRYYEDCTVLRSWIGIPLCMGLFDRAEGTSAALFSKYLWTGEGMFSAEGDKTHITWDRSALYAFRGVFASGRAAEASAPFLSYTRSRLLGEHVPYPVEAWPEGGKRHLSAESALYCRIVTEGIFGIDATGFGTFSAKANLPSGCREARLENIRAFGRVFDLHATADGAVRVLEHPSSVRQTCSGL